MGAIKPTKMRFTGHGTCFEEITDGYELLIGCEISSSHGDEYEVQICLLGCTVV
jgi:hypothetical protein